MTAIEAAAKDVEELSDALKALDAAEREWRGENTILIDGLEVYLVNDETSRQAKIGF